MSKTNTPSPKDQQPQPKGGKDPDQEMNWRGLAILFIAIALIGGAFLFKGNNIAQIEDIPLPKFESLLKDGKIISTADKPVELIIEEGKNTQLLTGFYRKKTATSPEEVPTAFKTTVYMPYNGTTLEKEMAAAGITPTPHTDSNVLVSTIISFLPIALFLLVLYFFFRSQIKMAGRSAMSFGKSKAKMLAREKNKITFKDVAGVEEAKDEVQELVEFLKDPKRFQKLGGRIPKGVLMIGAPGTGKTLLARAIAGEADVPFFNISGSDFVEMFVGVGASRVRDMFEQGRKSAPCLIFIDEIDAVGRQRGQGMGGGHDEREQTLNQLLVEMDGFDAQEGVIIIAATNRPDVLDPALLRPGRFDRQVTISLPDVKGREEILKVHAKKVKLSEHVDLSRLARGTPGYSGAELANVLNEAALLAARRGLKSITQAELEEARDKVRWGKERRSMAMSEKEKISTAWHEAGHALLNVVLKNTNPLHKVTIIPRGQYLGATMNLPEGDKYSTQCKEALDTLTMTMGGRIAEEMFTDDVSNGAAGDIAQATSLARKMVCEWGMSSLGMIRFTEESDYQFLGREVSSKRAYSEATAQMIDTEVKRLIDEAYARATQLLEEKRDKVALIAKGLLEFETLDGEQVTDLINFGSMKNPPIIEQKPPPLPPTPIVSSGEVSKPKLPDFPTGGLAAPVPA
ncbi:MAG TPA: ATP-dependent zinc metalloprotease FtsH [Chthoniobacterales bacterium]|nr:ATP-dependent zinc metalloprotease FtsH [Chthoniobacterales bacterium]